MNERDDEITILDLLTGWQEGCWTAAKTGKPFAVECPHPKNYEVIGNTICEAYNYTKAIFGHRITFTPKPA